MIKVLVLYYSQSGNTKKMAHLIAEGCVESGAEVTVESVDSCEPSIMLDYDCILLGSPTYYGLESGSVKIFMDKSIEIQGKLSGKIGGAFCSAGGIGGGGDIAITNILKMLMVHGMIVQGHATGGHFGPVSIETIDDRVIRECRNAGATVVKLARSIGG